MVQKWPSYQLRFFRQYRPGNCLLRYSRPKKNCLGYKNKKLKSRKIHIFPKGLTHGFGPKMAIFPTFFFQAIQARQRSFTKFKTKKTTVQAIKTRTLKSRKMDIFPKVLTNRFGPKMAIFPILFFQAIQAKQKSFTIFYNEKTPFQAIKTRS